MNWVDLAVLGIVLVSGLIAALRGLVREVLGLFAWGAAAFIASPYGLFPYVAPWMRHQFSDSGLAQVVAFGTVFLLSLIVLWLLVGSVADLVRRSALGGLDRALGLVFGVVRGAALVSAAYMIGGRVLAIEQWPPPVLEARSLPFAFQGAVKLAEQLPAEYRPPVSAPPGGRAATSADLMRAAPAGRALGARPLRE